MFFDHFSKAYLLRWAFSFFWLRCLADTPGDDIVLRPNGTYGVNFKIMKLTDTSRTDPFSPTSQPRSVLVSAIYPSAPLDRCKSRLAEYVPPATVPFFDPYYSAFKVPNGTIGRVKLATCEDDPEVARHVEDLPVVLFSPGFGGSRLIYSSFALQIASQGHLVVTIDHPYDTKIMQYPDGQQVLGIPLPNTTDNQTIQEFIYPRVSTRAHDFSFVLDQLSSPEVVNQVLPCARGPLKTDRAVIFGHSLGGAAAAAVMLDDARFRGGVNIDGTFYGLGERAPDRPLMIVSSAVHNQSNDNSWGATWRRLGGWKLEIAVEETLHDTFTDFPLILDEAGLRGPDLVPVLGTIEGKRMVHDVVTYVTAFFNFVLSGVAPAVLRGPDPEFPDVLFNVTGSNGTKPSSGSLPP